jgi:hypothetical protein
MVSRSEAKVEIQAESDSQTLADYSLLWREQWRDRAIRTDSLFTNMVWRLHDGQTDLLYTYVAR